MPRAASPLSYEQLLQVAPEARRPPAPAQPVGHEDGLVAYWTFDSTTDPLLDVVGGRRLMRVEASGINTCSPSDPRAHWTLVQTSEGRLLRPDDQTETSTGKTTVANVEACKASCDSDSCSED